MKKSLSKIVVLFALFALVSFFGETSLAKGVEKKYPPYPDVWGYDLRGYGLESNIPMVYKMDNGEVVFIYTLVSKNYNDPSSKGSYLKINFFSKKIEKITDNEANEFYKNNKQSYLSPKNYGAQNRILRFQDGTTLELTSGLIAAKLCHQSDLTKFLAVIKDASGATIEKKLLFGLRDKVEIRDVSEEYCDLDVGRSPIQYFILYPLLESAIQLDDDTFITFPSEYPIIIRFNKSLKTSFNVPSVNADYIRLGLKKSFYVIDKSVLDEAVKEKEKLLPKSSDFQLMHDLILSKLLPTKKE